MIKRIIFDIDNTILDTSKDCLDAYKEYFEENNYNVTAKDLYDLIEKYELLKKDYSIKDISKFIKDNLIETFTENDFINMLEIYGNHATLLEENVEEIFKYLSSKYELVALSNWYSTAQKSRLEKVGLLKYFKNVYCFAEGVSKPNKESFEIAKGPYSYNECIMIGDSIKNDIMPAIDLNMKAILLTKEQNKEYETISSLQELKSIL